MTLKIGYARVSSDDQNLDLQYDALRKAGCKTIYEDKASGGSVDRPGLQNLLLAVRKGDLVVVWRLDRLARSLKDLLELAAELESKGAGLSSVCDKIDTSSSGGKLIFQVFGAISEFERNLVRERTQAGLAAARKRGRIGGRPKRLDTEQRKMLVRLYNSKEHSVSEICKLLNISKPTLYNYLEAASK
jgi:DNA invertase Pin-like site-specific DNA recombinase